MRYLSLQNQRDGILLAARILLVALFVIFGWQKLTGFSSTVGYMTTVGAPFPALSAIIAVVVEFGIGIVVLVGFFTRPLALLLAVYTVATAFIGHRYWALSGMEHTAAMIGFYKNVSIAGGFLLLALTGPGRISLDRR